ncbi:MAG TPA: PstS family phosphate ABC transporter substrate-binding protein [Pyrinomonadaceae bacterium]|nr:PstS family phosphate ABC transporter substrate-binding protein [Pyrinomonadaceae bacterium]
MRNFTRLGLPTALASVLIIAGCGKPGDTGNGGGGAAGGARLIKIDGSSTVFPVTEAVAEEFQKEKRGGVRVTVGISGTGGGFKKFARGEIDVTNASRPILKEEMEQAKQNGVEFIELPVAFDALTVVVHPENDWVTSMTVADLKKIWEPEAQEKVTHWNHVRPEWPKEKIALFGAGSDSGTFDYFTEAVVGKAKASRGDYTASEDDNVLVQGIEGNKYALGYIPYAYYAPHSTRMKAVGIEWDKNKTAGPVMPSPENILAGTYNPLSRPLFIYVSRKSLDKPEVREFVEFYLKNVGTLSREVKYLPLPDTAYQMASERLRTGQTGTGFGGVPEVGLPVEEILRRPPKS